MENVRKRARVAETEVHRLQKRLQKLTNDHGTSVDTALNDDLTSIMKDKSEEIRKAYPEENFGRLFWEEQLHAATAKDPRQMRWHPLMIQRCLNLKSCHEECRLHKAAI